MDQVHPVPDRTDHLHPRSPILGVPISAITIADALHLFGDWVRAGDRRYVCVADVHSVMRTRTDSAHAGVMKAADMITPDGAPLVWTARTRGCRTIARVCGPDLLLQACARSLTTGWRHFFLGGAEGVPERLQEELERRFPGLKVVGAYSPPFRELSAEEDAALMQRLNESGADIVWIGLGCPKQERWMAEHVSSLNSGVLVGVGAAFDFYGGKVRRAPTWMRTRGLEWLHRLASEPRRLWKRYLVFAPQFVLLSVLETVRCYGRSPGTKMGRG